MNADLIDIAIAQVFKAVKGGVQDVVVKVLSSRDSELATKDLRKVSWQGPLDCCISTCPESRQFVTVVVTLR